MGTNNANAKKILFLCTGNYYRSRLAEILFNHYATEADMECEAESRGLSEKSRMSGLSPVALRYLHKLNFEGPEQFAREPMPIRVEDFEKFDLIVAMNRKEHEPLLKTRFGQMAKLMEQKGRLRYLNVFDVPSMRSWSSRIFGSRFESGDQPEESSTEHIDFAVRALLLELSAHSPNGTPHSTTSS